MPSVETRPLADGGTRYVVRVRNPWVTPGKKGYHTSATYATRAEAERFVRDCDNRGVAWALTEYWREEDAAYELTLDDWAVRHFASLPNVTAGTLTTYRRIYERAWSPRLGSLRLSQLNRETISAALVKVPGSDKTVRNAWGVLASMCKVAVSDGLLAKSPCVGIKLARRTEHETPEHRYLTVPEFSDLLDATPAHWRPLIWMLAGTGMRWGEAAALTVADVNLTAATVRINKAEKWDASKSVRVVGPTKTRKSRRTVTLPVEVVDAVRPLCNRKGNERLFLPPRSGPLRHKTFYTDIWIPSCVKAGLEPRPRLHDIRHSQVAWLIAQGVPLPIIQARLGHERITTTIDTYGHLLPDLQRAASDAASVVLSGVRPAIEP